MKHKDHESTNIPCLILTISSSRTEREDQSGDYIESALREEGYVITEHRIIADDYKLIEKQIENSRKSSCRVIIMTGGTGISSTDTTIEAVQNLTDFSLPGFGEIFRMLSYQEIGANAFLSRATAGVANDSLIFALPGSPKAVQLALNNLILPILGHAVYELDKDKHS